MICIQPTHQVNLSNRFFLILFVILFLSFSKRWFIATDNSTPDGKDLYRLFSFIFNKMTFNVDEVLLIDYTEKG